ncbi:preprotein translocase subunit SecA [Staphylococcus piscifermentans]|uniref:Protein translocase subunit SecA n=1 Tax=Staphylococcus piscifermentans TaxID=70258 RepID=A0A239TLL4_9STAP|nr:accessory Sec system translocase SecA2 [Staphylococcus piscifermentans]RTX85531.1 accessory Sec system translocase SecA2 [Staphylococcus piscifermentans]GEP85485.1 protein translocase subunit SecA 2 [Staphylococcus piscifermentans]SNU97493.1 preprotein translocase subunit SecA [Staphylococcus piscifermentans]
MANAMQQTINRLRLWSLEKTLRKINQLSDTMAAKTDAELQKQTAIFKAALQNGKTLTDILPEAYATAREASKRVLGMYPKDVQVLGAIVLHEGNIAEMQTGEGKTLTATLPLYLNALSGKGAFLVTTNDYLAERDYEEMRPLYEWLGLTTSLGFIGGPDYEYQPGEKQAIYNADIIYTTNGRLGFDYLIDNLADSLEGKFMPDLNYALIDEIDSIILDAAQTPLVISGAPRVQSNLFEITKQFVQTLEKDRDFKIDERKKEVWLTSAGIQATRDYFNVPDLYEARHLDLIRNINLALRARYLFEADIDYYVLKGEIVLIDRITGRLLPGTKLQSGLHQAIEAKEDIEITNDMSIMATITFQNLFKQFNQFSGMTGTAKQGEKELNDLYSKIVVQIPTDKPVQREDYKDRVFMTIEDKNKALMQRLLELYQSKRPVLLITRTAEAAEQFSMFLFQNNIPNNLLIAQNAAKEAQMIAEAGQLGAVTVATSMAGRGTDIKLEEGVAELGGLAVLVHEHMDNSRVDRQLRGRSGRQGDPGSSQIYISLEDYVVKRWGNTNLLENDKLKQQDAAELEQSPLFRHKVSKIVHKAQQISEEQGIAAREMANEFEKSISIQRDLIYKERDNILALNNFGQFDLERMAEDVYRQYVQDNWGRLDADNLRSYIYKNVSFDFKGDFEAEILESQSAVINFLVQLFQTQKRRQAETLNDAEMYHEFLQKCVLKAIDQGWIRQVDHLQQLKGSVNNRQNGQRNAIFEYHRAALESYEAMGEEIKHNMIRNISLSMVTFGKKDAMIIHFP